MGEGELVGGALAGIKVLEAGVLVQGPQASALLGQLGADVVKVELPGSATWPAGCPPIRRRVPQPVLRGVQPGQAQPGARPAPTSRPGRLPPPRRAGRRRDHQLQAGNDGVVGLGYAELSARNPAIIVATGSAFGPVAPTPIARVPTCRHRRQAG